MEENFEKSVENEEINKESMNNEVVNETPKSCENGKKCCGTVHWILEGLLAAAVVALFILHFADGNKKAPVVQKPVEKGNGEVVFINIDSVNEHYELIKILKDSLEAEQQRQELVFNNRQKALETKAANFERNYSSGSLNPQQAQYAQQGLQEESARLQRDYSNFMEDFQTRYAAALEQMADSLNAAAQRVNETYNASYIFTYQTGGQLLYADPAHDITQEVLNELNKSFKKKK